MNKQEEITVIKKAIRDYEGSYKGIKLPKPQVSGTNTQNEAYNSMAAAKFYDTHFEVAKPKKIYIDNSRFIEGVCELAEKMVFERFGDDALIDDGSGGTRYNEEAQDLFNEVYDETETILNKTFKVHSEEDKLN